MNCCNAYGQCTQDHDCPVRTKPIDSNSCAAEGGNVWFVGPEPVEVSIYERIAIYLLLLVLSLISIGLVAVGSSVFYNHFFN